VTLWLLYLWHVALSQQRTFYFSLKGRWLLRGHASEVKIWQFAAICQNGVCQDFPSFWFYFWLETIPESVLGLHGYCKVAFGICMCFYYHCWFHCNPVEIVCGVICPAWGRGSPFPPCPFTSPSFALFLLFPFLVGFNYFLLLSIPLLSTRIVPLRFQTGGRRKRPNLGLVCCVYFVLSVFLSWLRWILVFCCIWFSVVFCLPSVLWHCWLGHLIRKNPSTKWPIMCRVGR